MKKSLLIVFIILILCSILLVGCGNSNTNSDVTDTSNTTSKSSEKASIKSKLVLGKYSIDANQEIIENGFGDEYIIFSEDNSFEAYLGWGSMLFGTYTISDNGIIKCLGKSHRSDYTDLQDVNVLIEFKSQDILTLEIVNSSDKYTIETSVLDESGKWVPSGETKEMLLYPYEVGNTFTLNNE